MMRITEISNLDNLAVLKLEGKIIDMWVDELEKECTRYLKKNISALVLDIADVSYISSEAISMLNGFKENLKIVNAHPYLELCLKNRGLKNQVI